MATQKHVCLVDDDSNTAFFVRRALKKVAPQARFTYYQDSRVALRELIEQDLVAVADKPDLLFLDLNMPTVSGWEFLAATCGSDGRQTHLDASICILSSSINADDIERAQRIPCVSMYVEKHVTVEKMRAALETVG